MSPEIYNLISDNKLR